MSPKKISDSTSNSIDRKGFDDLPDLEDLGKMLKACHSSQRRKSNQSKTLQGEHCLTCKRKDTCENAVQASSERIDHGSSKNGERTRNTKDNEMISSNGNPRWNDSQKGTNKL